MLWAYGFENEDVRVAGETHAYARGERAITFNFCRYCGCVAHWRAVKPNEAGRRRMGINLRLAEPDTVAAIPVVHLDGLETWKDLPRGCRSVGEMWF